MSQVGWMPLAPATPANPTVAVDNGDGTGTITNPDGSVVPVCTDCTDLTNTLSQDADGNIIVTPSDGSAPYTLPIVHTVDTSHVQTGQVLDVAAGTITTSFVDAEGNALPDQVLDVSGLISAAPVPDTDNKMTLTVNPDGSQTWQEVDIDGNPVGASQVIPSSAHPPITQGCDTTGSWFEHDGNRVYYSGVTQVVTVASGGTLELPDCSCEGTRIKVRVTGGNYETPGSAAEITSNQNMRGTYRVSDTGRTRILTGSTKSLFLRPNEDFEVTCLSGSWVILSNIQNMRGSNNSFSETNQGYYNLMGFETGIASGETRNVILPFPVVAISDNIQLTTSNDRAEEAPNFTQGNRSSTSFDIFAGTTSHGTGNALTDTVVWNYFNVVRL